MSIVRTNFVPEHRIGKGWQGSSHPGRPRVACTLDDPMFELLREIAIRRGCGLAALAREYIEAGLARDKQ